MNFNIGDRVRYIRSNTRIGGVVLYSYGSRSSGYSNVLWDDGHQENLVENHTLMLIENKNPDKFRIGTVLRSWLRVLRVSLPK